MTNNNVGFSILQCFSILTPTTHNILVDSSGLIFDSWTGNKYLFCYCVRDHSISSDPPASLYCTAINEQNNHEHMITEVPITHTKTMFYMRHSWVMLYFSGIIILIMIITQLFHLIDLRNKFCFYNYYRLLRFVYNCQSTCT